MGHANASGHLHLRVGHGDVLNVDRADPFTAGFDDVFAAVGDLHEAVGVDGGHVAGGEPAVDQGAGAFLAVILAQHPRPFDQQVACGDTVPGQILALGANDFHVNAVNAAPLFEANLHLLLGRQTQVFVFQGAQRAQGAHLGHAPSMQHLDPIVVFEGVDHGRWAGRAPNHGALQGAEAQAFGPHVAEHHLPHRGHACGKGDTLGFNQAVDRCAVQRRPRKHQFGTHHGGAVGNAPGIDVEHRHHGQDAVPGRHAHHIGQSRGIRMKNGGAMAVHGRFGVARGAAGVAHAGG